MSVLETREAGECLLCLLLPAHVATTHGSKLIPVVRSCDRRRVLNMLLPVEETKPGSQMRARRTRYALSRTGEACGVDGLHSVLGSLTCSRCRRLGTAHTVADLTVAAVDPGLAAAAAAPAESWASAHRCAQHHGLCPRVDVCLSMLCLSMLETRSETCTLIPAVCGRAIVPQADASQADGRHPYRQFDPVTLTGDRLTFYSKVDEMRKNASRGNKKDTPHLVKFVGEFALFRNTDGDKCKVVEISRALESKKPLSGYMSSISGGWDRYEIDPQGRVTIPVSVAASALATARLC